MTSRSYYSWLLVAGAFGVSVSLFSPTAVAQNLSGITAFVERDGRTVFTNFSISRPPTVTVPRAGPTIETVAAATPATGAEGLMQLIPDTASRFGVGDPFDAAQNIEGGVRYLRFLLEMFGGDFDLSVAAYNSGENRVARIDRIPDIAETQDYVRKVRASYARMGGNPDGVIRAATNQNVAAAVPAHQAAPGIDRSTELTLSDTPRVDTSSAQPVAIVQVISRSTNRRGVVSYTNLGATP